MFAAPEDSPADEGAGIAEDRRARILRRMLYPALALAAAGLIVVLGGCEWQDRGPRTEPISMGWVGETISVIGEVEGKWDASTIDIAGGRGYLPSSTLYGPDFTLTYEYRFPEAASMPEEKRPNCNTGCLLFITGEDKVWPRCLEVQGKWSETASIKSNARDVQVTATLDEPARDAARKPPGEWNRVEVVSRGGALTVSLNGVQVATSEPTDLTHGRIGFQAEGFPVEFRDVRIEE